MFKDTPAWQKTKDISKTSTASHQQQDISLTLLQSVDEPDLGPKPLDKETIFDVSASKLVGKEVENTDDLSSNRKKNPIPIHGYNIIDADIFRKCLAFVPNVYIVVEKSVYVYFNKMYPEKVFRRNYVFNVNYIRKH